MEKVWREFPALEAQPDQALVLSPDNAPEVIHMKPRRRIGVCLCQHPKHVFPSMEPCEFLQMLPISFVRSPFIEPVSFQQGFHIKPCTPG